jgi:hypothetical protein
VKPLPVRPIGLLNNLSCIMLKLHHFEIPRSNLLKLIDNGMSILQHTAEGRHIIHPLLLPWCLGSKKNSSNTINQGHSAVQ